MTRFHIACALCLCAVHGVSLAAQRPAGQAPAPASTPAPARTGVLAIGGDVKQPMTFTVAALRGLPRTTVKVEEDDKTVTYEGVLVGELLKRAGAPLGGELRGNAIASYILASASDGYQVVFSLAEVDQAFTANDIIVADTIDGKPLFDYQGPMRIVAPKDTKGARSIRMLERIDLVRLRR